MGPGVDGSAQGSVKLKIFPRSSEGKRDSGTFDDVRASFPFGALTSLLRLRLNCSESNLLLELSAFLSRYHCSDLIPYRFLFSFLPLSSQ